MLTKRFWAPLTRKAASPAGKMTGASDRRRLRRHPADFYGVEVVDGNRYLRRISNVSRNGLLLVNPLGDESPGQVIDLELPRRSPAQPPSRIKFEVVYVTPAGKVGVRLVESANPLAVEELGGPIAL
jgi:hypothetical protein